MKTTYVVSPEFKCQKIIYRYIKKKKNHSKKKFFLYELSPKNVFFLNFNFNV